MDSVEPGRACGSDTAHLALFGYDPRETYRGRGAFESLGAGCSMAPGDVAWKCNFATLADAAGGGANPVVRQRRVDRTFHEEGPLLCAALNGVFLRYLYRCAAAMHSQWDPYKGASAQNLPCGGARAERSAGRGAC